MTVLQLNPFESHTTDYSQKLKTNILTIYFEMKRHNTLYSTISNTLPSKTEKVKAHNYYAHSSAQRAGLFQK